MAYRSKRRYRSSRFSRRRRNYRSRWFRSKRRRYGYKISRRARRRVEYKRVELTHHFSFQSGLYQNANYNGGDNIQVITPYPYVCDLIGGPISVSESFESIVIDNGPAQGQRIGAKITPVKLRITGSIMFIPKEMVEPDQVIPDAFQSSLLPTPQKVFLRCIIFQVRNGNCDYDPYTEQFTSVNPYLLAPVYDNGNFIPLSVNGSNIGHFPSYKFMDKLFAEAPGYEEFDQVVTVGNSRVRQVFQGYKLATNQPEAYTQNMLLKMPFRNGIGTNLRILKDKVYSINAAVNQGFAFRFKTKKPARMVWPEEPNGDNQTRAFARNPIYVLWLPVFPYATYTGRIQVSAYYQMYYSDI